MSSGPSRRQVLQGAAGGAAGAGVRGWRALHRRRDRRSHPRPARDQPASDSVIQVATPATVAVNAVPHAMSTTVTTVGQLRSVAWFVRSYVAYATKPKAELERMLALGAERGRGVVLQLKRVVAVEAIPYRRSAAGKSVGNRDRGDRVISELISLIERIFEAGLVHRLRIDDRCFRDTELVLKAARLRST
mgnify:CR=1 FL=1